MSDDTPEIQDWLRRLKWSLTSVPSPERDDIVQETHAHLREAIAGGQTSGAVLAGFGTPEEYARQFVDEMDVSRALGSGRPAAMFATVVRRMHRSFIATLAFLAVFILGCAALGIGYTVVMKIVDPQHAGLWMGRTQFFIGTIDDPTSAHELLGYSLFPVAAMLFGGIWQLGRLILTRTLRHLAQSR